MHFDLSVAARKAVMDEYRGKLPLCLEGSPFSPPSNGATWMKFDYFESETIGYGLRKKCKSYIGMVQLSIFFMPSNGVDAARKLAKDIANFFYDDKMLSTGYIYSGGEVRPIQKDAGGWMLPIRFYVRFDQS